MVKSPQERLWLVGGVLAAVVVTLIGYFLLISPERADTQTVEDQVATAQQQATTLQTRIDQLTAQNKDLAKYRANVAQLRRALPSTSGLPDFLRTLQGLGNATRADVTSLTVGPPTDASTLPGGAPAAASTSPSNGAASSSSTSNQPAATPAGPHIYALAITALVSGSTTQLADFLDQLQSVQPRAVLISQITVGAGAAGGTGPATSSMSLTMKAFVAPADPSEAARLAQAAPPK
jgi:Tfp pilus assembly protein PilO